MTGAGERHRMAGQDVAQKLAERTLPALRAVQLAEGTQGIDEVWRWAGEFWSTASGGIVLPSR